MSTNIIFTVPGRTTNYMPIDVNAPKEVILEKYARLVYFLSFFFNLVFFLEKAILPRTHGPMTLHQQVTMTSPIRIPSLFY